MEWAKLFTPDKQPSESDISDYIHSPLWEDLNTFLCDNYEIKPSYAYSACSGQPGWNIKYQKAGRALCTLYPMEGFFIALVVIGNKELKEAELVMPSFEESTQSIFTHAGVVMGGRWLMIKVDNEKILDDVKRLIQLRRKIKKKV